MFTKRITLYFARRIRKYFAANVIVYPFAAIVGVLTAIFAHILHLLLLSNLDYANVIYYLNSSLNWRILVVFLLPFIGIFLSKTFQLLLCGSKFVKSLAPLILKLDRNRGDIPFKDMFTHIISSSLSVGFGGSAGLEAPSVLTGSAIGACVSRTLCIQGIPRSMLVSCGASAAISAVFHSPIAAVLFVVEALLPECTFQTTLPPMIASACSAAVTWLFFSEEGAQVFFMNSLGPWGLRDIFAVFFCGIFTALVGVFIIKSTIWVGVVTNKIKSQFLRFIIGCMILCIILFTFPMLRGQGYDSIEQLLLNDTTALTEAPYLLQGLPPAVIPCLILLAVFFLKPAASALTIQNGDGGIFAPTMFIGAYTGFFFAQMFNKLGIGHINTCNFAAIGICGVFAAVMRSPLAAVFLVAETTGGFGLFVPLTLASAISCIFGRMMEPCSIYKKSLIAQGLISEDPLESRLKRIPVGRCFVSPPITFRQDMLMGYALSLLKTEAPSYALSCVPVLNADGTLAGLIQLTELFDASAYVPTTTVGQVMRPPIAIEHDTDTLDKVVKAMNKAKTNILPVLYFEDEKFVGLVSKESIFDKYVK